MEAGLASSLALPAPGKVMGRWGTPEKKPKAVGRREQEHGKPLI